MGGRQHRARMESAIGIGWRPIINFGKDSILKEEKSMESMKICNVEGCEKIAPSGRTMCYMHRERFKKYKSFNLPEKEKMPEGIVKNCKIHGYRTKEQVTFHARGNSYCLECKKEDRKSKKEEIKKYNSSRREKRQEWVKKDRLNNPERYKKYGRNGHLKNKDKINKRTNAKKYGLTVDEYKGLLEKASNKCEICGNIETRYTAKKINNSDVCRLCIDHDHFNGNVRGILCFKCNIGLGNFNDDSSLVLKAYEYLEKHKCE